MSTLALKTFSQAFAEVRGILMDKELSSGAVFKDSVLLPFANQVWGEIQDEFKIWGIPFGETVIQSTDVSYTAGDSTIKLAAGITDFESPLEIWERGSASEQWIIPAMARLMRLPPPLLTQQQFLGVYEFSEGLIKVLPASTNRLIMMRYQRQLAAPAASTAVSFDGFYYALVAGTAAAAAPANDRTEKRTALLEAKYRKRLDDAIAVRINNQQAVEANRTGWGDSRDDISPFVRFQ